MRFLYIMRAMKPLIQAFFDTATSTVTYVVYQADGGECAIIDSVLDYDPKSGRTATRSADLVLDFVREHQLKAVWLLETHAHADHLSGASYLQRQLGGRIAIGAGIRDVQRVFRRVFNANDIAADGAPFDHLFADGERFRIGTLEARVMHTPGHTPACATYVVESDEGLDAFVGDTLFMPDYGTARCDFPGGDAATLYRSIRRLLALPSATRLHLCHDYPPQERAPQWVTTVAEQRRANVHVHDGVDETAFVALRTARDRTLAMPALMLPSVQVNVRAGRFPPAEDNGTTYLKIPVDAL